MASIARQSPLLRQTCLSAFRSPLAAKNVTGVSQVVAFHASAKKQILPPLPQVVQGTMNDPAPIPKPSPSHGSYHWTFERLVSVGLIPLTIAPFAAGSLNPVMDAVLCSLLVVHSHIGFQASIIDYFPERRVPKFRTFLNWLLRAFTLTTAVGLYEFETNDVGVTEAIKRVWKA
ncbi:succinate dehydrogenase cytochrome b small subunit, mitochondrial precursor [Aspergillus terreus NIH2624]|uniref:Succinate dehydrogenase [ubiquinone] cytochrome b small subunit n=1 Tax=Aspergillus terreus (strain NIH 2624 / FGSC A1156) TaxID=341663 RepID=Q0CM49_ASPTN|nr:succinate dehydrogenase cytochrome b small subunit, mitochondrial precursor [Aspergillus terreus NIH2624]EAU34304.1 succinate dehydrogenase cytochrome b small subunit, mitochondrial precursor [Aspergillus terreus NIH2624]